MSGLDIEHLKILIQILIPLLTGLFGYGICRLQQKKLRIASAAVIIETHVLNKDIYPFLAYLDQCESIIVEGKISLYTSSSNMSSCAALLELQYGGKFILHYAMIDDAMRKWKRLNVPPEKAILDLVRKLAQRLRWLTIRLRSTPLPSYLRKNLWRYQLYRLSIKQI